MTRFLLTLLALLTGLTVSGGSAEARICGVGKEQIGLAEVSSQESRSVVHEASAAPLAPRLSAVERASLAVALPEVAPVVTVRMQADRARE